MKWNFLLLLLLSLAAAALQRGMEFGFIGPELYKFDWGISQLQVADVNGDGLNDIALVNNARARIEFLIQRSEGARKRAADTVRLEENLNVVPDDTRFEKRPFLHDKHVYAFRLGDINSDGRPDIVFYGEPRELVVVYNRGDGTWGEQRTFNITDGATTPFSLAIGDLNGDKRNDIVLLGQSDTYFIYQDERGALREPVKVPGPGGNVAGLDLADLDGDGRLDLYFVDPSASAPLIVRLQDPYGRVGPQLALRIPTPRSLEIKDCDGDGRAEIILVEQRSGRLKIMRLARSPLPPIRLLGGEMRRYPLPRVASALSRAMALGDIDGDKKTDVLLTDPAAAQIELYRQGERGELISREVFPTLKNVTAIRIIDLDADGKVEVLLLSPDERMIGLSRLEAAPSRPGEGRLSFPKPLKTQGKPLCFDVADINGDARCDIVYVASEDAKRFIHALQSQPSGKPGELVARQPILIENCRTDPIGLRIADANRDGRPDILLFIPYEALRIFTQDETGRFSDRSQSEIYRQGLVANAIPSALSVADVDNDGKPELLLAEKNFARQLVLDEQGSILVLDQYNGRTSTSQIVGVVALDLDGDGQKEIVLVDKSANCLSLLKRKSSGSYELAENLEIGPFLFEGIFIEDMDGDIRPDIVLFGKEEFIVLHTGIPVTAIEDVAAYETKIPQGQYHAIAVGDLNSDGLPDLLLTEISKHSVEVLTFEVAKQLRQGVQFRVFEGKQFSSGRPAEGQAPEPREALIADVTGDNKPDIILIVHDRVIVYPQE